MADVLHRLTPLVELALQKETFINIDMEHYASRDLTLEIVKRLPVSKKVKGYPHVGTVFQAYLKDTESTLDKFLDWFKTKQNNP